MASEGPNAAGTGTAANNGGDVAWSNPENVTASDTTYATCALAAMETSQDLQASNFGFTLPDSTVDGIEFSITRQQDGSGVAEDLTVEILDAGGDDKFKLGSWPGSDVTAFYGGASDDWNAGQLYTDINNSAFALKIRAHESGGLSAVTAKVDYVRCTVTYTETASGKSGVQTRVARTRRSAITRM